MNANDDLKAEYILIQNQYEGFDQRALSLKALATPLLGAGLATGLSAPKDFILWATILAALSLWVLEAIWKSFQYCLTDRIKALEAWYRGEHEGQLAPFQIFTWWGQVWHRHYRHPRSLIPILRQPFVFLPYIPIIVVGVFAIAWRALFSM